MTRTNDEIFDLPQDFLLPPVHPGKTVARELAARELTPHRAALMMRIPPNRLSLIVSGRRGITADTALRLARLFGTGAQFWMNLQMYHDLATTEMEKGARIATEVEAA